MPEEDLTKKAAERRLPHGRRGLKFTKNAKNMTINTVAFHTEGVD